jgi:uncharacterized protein (DUF1330 family)
MAKGYWIAHVDVADMEKYKEYSAEIDVSLRKYGGRFIVRGGRAENVEGSNRSRHIVIEFPSYQAALDCWNSPEYKKALAIRAPVTAADIVVIEGHDG